MRNTEPLIACMRQQIRHCINRRKMEEEWCHSMSNDKECGEIAQEGRDRCRLEKNHFLSNDNPVNFEEMLDILGKV